MEAAVRSFDSRELRQVLGSFFTGVTVVTTVDGHGKPHGLTANSFSSVSLDPPLILWSQSRNAPSHPVFRTAERFAVNILADDQVEVSNRFARGGADKFSGIATRAGEHRMPLIEGCAAHLECRLVNAYPGGDHVVFIGEVERIARHGRPPLLFGGGRYLVAQPHDLGPPTDRGANIARLNAVRIATRALVELSDELDETLGLGVWGNKGPTIVRWEEASEPVSDNLRTGLVLPVLTSVTGLAFAAWLPAELTAPFVAAELADGAAPDIDATGLAQQLASIRAAGFASLVGSDGFADLYGTRINAVSVPVFDLDGAMVLALTAIGAAGRLDTGAAGALVQRLLAAALDLSTKLARRAA
ncbi:MAG: flavin reductase [Burkholderiales bacterium]|nr:flavin reductase [Burkholderiales bacterium]